MARPSQFTEEIREQIITSVREGNFLRHAAEAAGVSESTVRHWLARGRAEDGPKEFRDFVTEIQRAQSQAVGDAVERIRAASFSDWKAAAWFLARKCPEEWGDKAKKTAREAIEEVLQTVEEVLGSEHATKVWDALSARAGGQESPGAASSAADRGNLQ